MTGEEITKSLALVAAWKHEHHNGVNGMLAVLLVLRNRVNEGWFNGDWMQNIGSLLRHTWDSPTIEGESDLPDVREPNFIKLIQYIDGIFDGTQPDSLTDGSLYFRPTGSQDTQDLWVPAAVIGSTTYYKVRK
jgi:hypothetical protein